MVYWQVVYLWVAPRLVKEEKISILLVLVQLVFMLQFIPKVYHCYCLMQRSRQVTGYVFGSIWWRFGLGFTAYFLASHVRLLSSFLFNSNAYDINKIKVINKGLMHVLIFVKWDVGFAKLKKTVV